MTETNSNPGSLALTNLLKNISWAITTMSRQVLWKSVCLDQAVAGKIMLWRRGIHSTLYLGLAKKDDDELLAHAWLRSGEIILTGWREKDNYAVVATFGKK